MTNKGDVIIDDLEIMAAAVNYRDWIYRNISPSLGRRIIEMGAGVGTFTELLLDRELVVVVDRHQPALDLIMRRYGDRNNIETILMDISGPRMRDLGRYRPDTVVCLNVLEHVEDDRAALSNMHSILDRGGQLALLVPAFPFAFGSIDRLIGHHRRYRKKELRSKLVDAGFVIKEMYYMNALALPGWFVNNRLLKRRQESQAQVLLFDRRVVPWLSRIEQAVRPPFGLSLVALCGKG